MAFINYFKNLQFNIRFYILAAAVVLSVTIASWLRLTVPSDQLFYIRLQQVYGLLAVLLLYSAVLLTPVSKVFKGKKWLDVSLFARRAIGVSAAYFAVLHTLIALVDQLGGISKLALLPQRFIVAFVLGGTALLILLLMAATSFDAAITKMTFKNWKRLHSFVYLAGALIIIHVWLIGTHSDVTNIRIASAAALALLFALESNRTAMKLTKRFKLSRPKKIVVGLGMFAVLFGSLWLLPLLSANYHTAHEQEAATAVPQEAQQ